MLLRVVYEGIDTSVIPTDAHSLPPIRYSTYEIHFRVSAQVLVH